jgi:hypothetical protein
MTRQLYSLLICLHPPFFRARFGDEMLCIFDESSAHGRLPATLLLFADALLSILRQWIVGCGTWKIAAGILGGMLHLWLVFGLLMLRPPLHKVEPEMFGEPLIFHHESAFLKSGPAPPAQPPGNPLDTPAPATIR